MLPVSVRTSQHEREPRSARVADVAKVQHVNRKGDSYYLHQGRTKTGKPKYFFSKKPVGRTLRAVAPTDLKSTRIPGGQVYCRRIQPKLITEQEIEVVREAIRKCGKQLSAVVDVKGKDIIVYESEHPCLKFTLCDAGKRLFSPSRWCYLGSIDDWVPLFGGPKILVQNGRELLSPHRRGIIF